MKRKIFEKRERRVSVADVASTCNRSASTICTFLENKDLIEEIEGSKGATRISTQFLDDVESLLLIWMHENQMPGDDVKENSICERMKVIFADIF
ncbi:hypothetical protein AVEN_205403-1 [Araneus ventricosus]|uniref:HTH CENPB-type domain-containing protein n=1 Tax=Araneus ventricosus TaxID=182803 RepID=A0A4Y2J616_ARAVE|nr:hypothetical protein AVEN_205403-1 [Araneus ventricosus]